MHNATIQSGEVEGKKKFACADKCSMIRTVLIFLMKLTFFCLGFFFVGATFLSAQTAPNVNGTVYAAAPQADGKVVLAGQFTDVNNQQAQSIARLNGDGSLDTGFPAGGSTNGIFGIVYAVAVGPDGSIVAGGEFNRAGSTQALNIVRYLPDGTIDSAFSANGGINGPVYAVAVLPNGQIAAGGQFTMAGNQPAQNFAVLNPDGSQVSAATANVPTGLVRAVAPVQGSSPLLVAVGGNFVIGGPGARNFALLPAGE